MIYGRKWREYAKQWDDMIINPSRVQEAERAAKYAVANKDIYKRIESITGIPWPMIACDHRRESDREDKAGNPLFSTYLGNGQDLWIKTTIVPIGRGPFIRQSDAGRNDGKLIDAFVVGGVDAYTVDHINRVSDWRLEKILYYSELFNGTGYDSRGLPSAYIWGGTNQQKPGKYVGDHRWRGDIMDTQLGVAPILWWIEQIDDSVKYVRES